MGSSWLNARYKRNPYNGHYVSQCVPPVSWLWLGHNTQLQTLEKDGWEKPSSTVQLLRELYVHLAIL